MSEETQHEYINRRMTDSGLRPMRAIQIDQGNNFNETLDSMLTEHIKKWSAGGMKETDICMSMITGMMHLSVRMMKASGMNKATVQDMLGVTVEVVYSGDVAACVEAAKKYGVAV